MAKNHRNFYVYQGISMQKHTKKKPLRESRAIHLPSHLPPSIRLHLSGQPNIEPRFASPRPVAGITRNFLKPLVFISLNVGRGICNCQAGCLWIKKLMVEAWWCLTCAVLGSFSLLNSPSLTPEHRAKQGDVTWELIPAV